MSQYHQKLVITQNISLALKMIDEMESEAKTKSLELIIDRLILDVNKHLSQVVGLFEVFCWLQNLNTYDT